MFEGLRVWVEGRAGSSKLIRNQQVRGSSPRAGSKTHNNNRKIRFSFALGFGYWQPIGNQRTAFGDVSGGQTGLSSLLVRWRAYSSRRSSPRFSRPL